MATNWLRLVSSLHAYSDLFVCLCAQSPGVESTSVSGRTCCMMHSRWVSLGRIGVCLVAHLNPTPSDDSSSYPILDKSGAQPRLHNLICVAQASGGDKRPAHKTTRSAMLSGLETACFTATAAGEPFLFFLACEIQPALTACANARICL
jgi:hypothetical protein